MKIRIIFLFILALVFNANSVEAQKKRPQLSAKVLTAREIAEKVMPSVLMIVTSDADGNRIAQGSGFLFKSGIGVSNLHVFKRATTAVATNVKTGISTRIVEILGIHIGQDLCVFRIENGGFPPVRLGDSYGVRVGDEVYVASNPKGLEGSFTKGIISAVRASNRIARKESPSDEFLRKYIGDSDRTSFQLDAAISPGSSGGVVVNSKGEAIGIIRSSVVSGQNLNFAIPTEQLLRLPLRFKESVEFAGACAYSNREQDELLGPVKKVVEKSRHTRIENGQLIDEGVQIDSVRVYTFGGDLAEYYLYDAVTGKLGVKMVYLLDDSGLKTAIVYETPDGKKSTKNFDLADGIYNRLYGRKFGGSVGDPDKPGGKQVFDANGLRTDWFIGGKRIVYTYGANRRSTESVQLNGSQPEIRKKFSYRNDVRGNWLEMIEVSNFPNARGISPDEWVGGETTYREIEYYD